MNFLAVKLVSLGLFLLMGAVIAYGILVPFQLATLELLRAPWMITSIVDVYVGIFFFTCWVAHREGSWWATLCWIPLFIVLGNMATAFYVLVTAFRARSDPTVFWNGDEVSDKWMR
jgi:hypothetical protein